MTYRLYSFLIIPDLDDVALIREYALSHYQVRLTKRLLEPKIDSDYIIILANAQLTLTHMKDIALFINLLLGCSLSLLCLHP